MTIRVLAAAAMGIAFAMSQPVLAADMAGDAMMADPMAAECFEKARMETDTAMMDAKLAECHEMYPDAMMEDGMMKDDAMAGDAMEGDAM
jgi:hypothetical protein